VAEITPEHLLLGILQVDEPLMDRFVSRSVRDSLLRTVSTRPHAEASSTAASLGSEARLVFETAAEQREQLGHKHTGTEHLLLGILLGRSDAAKALKEHGVNVESVRDSIRGHLMAVRQDAHYIHPVPSFR
jgi:ATP-dependent Clp protease ATP-binding subunit ClpC